MTDPDPLADWRSNPFFVLEIPIDATPSEVERAGQKLLALLAIGSDGVGSYMSPLGMGQRDASGLGGPARSERARAARAVGKYCSGRWRAVRRTGTGSAAGGRTGARLD
jgi:hypothetical protein